MAALATQSAGASGPADFVISLDYAAVPGTVRHLRDAVAAFAECHGACRAGVDDIRTAVSEAATNVVVHAYAVDDVGRVRVRAVVGGDDMVVVIDDDGRGINAPAQNPGLGMGLGLMRQMSEQAVFLTREQGGSTVQLRFRL